MRTLLALCLLASGCGGAGSEDSGDEDSFPPGNVVPLPDDLVSSEPRVVLRLTDSHTTANDVYVALNTLFNETVPLADLLTRGGIPRDDDGNELLPLGSDPATLLAGTSVEQLKAYYDKTAGGGAPFTPAEAVDACGNPAVASLVTPDLLQHATSDAAGDAAWPDACNAEGLACDTLEHGTVEVVLSNQRADGMVDVVLNVFPQVVDVPTPTALYGHLVAGFLSSDNPGFTRVPLVLNATQFQVAMFNLWQLDRSYADGWGQREVYVFPHAAREVATSELLVASIPQSADDCTEAWEARFPDSLPPFGCAEESSLLLDRNSDNGQSVWSTYMKEGADASHLAQLVAAFEYSLKAAMVCPPVTFGAWVQEGPVELFLCPEGDIDTCIASQDMEEGACRPTGETPWYPESGEPVVLAEQQDPVVVESGLTAYGEDPTGWTGDPPLPWAGGPLEIELTVDEDTVLYLREPERIVSVSGPGVTELPEPLDDSHCVDDPTKRYEIGAAWGPGSYTLQLTWSDAELPFWVNLTSVPTWVP